MDLISIVKLLGAGEVERDLAKLLKKHVTSPGYAVLGDLFTAGAEGCAAKDPEAVATAITHLIFSIH